MKKLMALLSALICVLSLVGCNDTATQEQPDGISALEYDFSNAVPFEVNDDIIQNCVTYAENVGYETGELKKAVLLGEERLNSVYCDDETKQDLIDSRDVVVIFENIRCVVDTETGIVLGRIPFV